ncbi:helix-turn-helix domain-containing protein [Streptomyces echinatus]|uniref:AraC-like ligand-binding domain-containing protein n=1 Tax=Streptomyces echinatus TaxID=67293 RepID=UPI0031EBA01B
MEQVLSTDTMPAGDGLDRWRPVLATALAPMAVTPRGSGSLAGRITGGRLGSLRTCSLEADAVRLSGRPAHHGTADEPCVAVLVLTTGTATLLQDGRHAVAATGDLLVYDTARPYTLDFPERFVCHLVHLPRRGLDCSDEELRAVTATAVAGTDGFGALLGPFLATLLASAHAYGPVDGARLAASVVDLFGTLVAERNPLRGIATGREDLVLRVRDHIDRHLADPGLAPEAVAAAHHISLRYLHRIFEDEGITVARLIQRRRLEECARELARGGRAAPAVAVVANRWGFVNPAHFSRVFRGVYGHSPREWRRRAAAAQREGLPAPSAAGTPSSPEGPAGHRRVTAPTTGGGLLPCGLTPSQHHVRRRKSPPRRPRRRAPHPASLRCVPTRFRRASRRPRLPASSATPCRREWPGPERPCPTTTGPRPLRPRTTRPPTARLRLSRPRRPPANRPRTGPR